MSTGLAVDEQLLAPDLDLAESNALLDGLEAPAFRIVQDQIQIVQVRSFRRPQQRIRHPGGQPRSAVDGFRSPRARNRYFGVRKPSRHFWRPLQPSLLPKHIHGQQPIGVCGVHIRHHVEISDVRGWLGVQVDVPFYARDAPEILAFEVAAVRPPVHLDRQGVGPRLKGIGDIKLCRQFRALAVADGFAVHPQVKGGLHRAKVHNHLLAIPRRG